MSDAHQPPQAPVAAAKTVRDEVFYTRGSRDMEVSLRVNKVETKGAPDFDGQIGGKQVAAWIHINSATGAPFLAIHRSQKGPDGKYQQLGTARVVINDRGMVRLAITLQGERGTLWASVTKYAPDGLLERCGYRKDVQDRKRAAFLEREAAEKAAAAAKQTGQG